MADLSGVKPVPIISRDSPDLTRAAVTRISGFLCTGVTTAATTSSTGKSEARSMCLFMMMSTFTIRPIVALEMELWTEG